MMLLLFPVVCLNAGLALAAVDTKIANRPKAAAPGPTGVGSTGWQTGVGSTGWQTGVGSTGFQTGLGSTGWQTGSSGCGSTSCGLGSTSGCGSKHSTSCGLGSTYVTTSNPCGSSCYSNCGSWGCGGSTGSAPLCKAPATGPTGSSGCASSIINPASFPDCQCDWLFNSHGQGNCNEGSSSNTKDRWCYIATDVNGKWIQAQSACPDSKASEEYRGKFWSNMACDTPRVGGSW